MKLENIMLSEISQTQKKNATCYHLHDSSKIVKLTAENKTELVRG